MRRGAGRRDQSAPRRPRTVFWYVKFLAACYGIGVAGAMLTLILSLPTFGPRLLVTRWHGIVPLGAVIFALTLAAAPFVWSRIR